MRVGLQLADFSHTISSVKQVGIPIAGGENNDLVVGHHPTMPGVGKTPQAVVATGRLEDSLHASMMTILPCLGKTTAPASSAVPRHPTGPAKYGSRLVA